MLILAKIRWGVCSLCFSAGFIGYLFGVLGLDSIPPKFVSNKSVIRNIVFFNCLLCNENILIATISKLNINFLHCF